LSWLSLTDEYLYYCTVTNGTPLGETTADPSLQVDGRQPDLRWYSTNDRKNVRTEE
jgi:hypothetical protein